MYEVNELFSTLRHRRLIARPRYSACSPLDLIRQLRLRLWPETFRNPTRYTGDLSQPTKCTGGLSQALPGTHNAFLRLSQILRRPSPVQPVTQKTFVRPFRYTEGPIRYK